MIDKTQTKEYNLTQLGIGGRRMATDKQILNMLKQMTSAHPAELFKHMDDTRAGIGAVLKLLYTADAPITAGMISERLNVSTARVAVVLKKMDAKGLFTK